MIENLLRPGHVLTILAIYLVFFGAKDLPQMGRALGEAIRGFKHEVRNIQTALITEVTEADGKDDPLV